MSGIPGSPWKPGFLGRQYRKPRRQSALRIETSILVSRPRMFAIILERVALSTTSDTASALDFCPFPGMLSMLHTCREE